MGEGWDPLKEHLFEYVMRQRVEEQMLAYDDKVERRLEQSKALGLYWARPCANDDQLALLLTVTVHDNDEAA